MLKRVQPTLLYNIEYSNKNNKNTKINCIDFLHKNKLLHIYRNLVIVSIKHNKLHNKLSGKIITIC